ncbi:OsmC family protein [Fundicoccus culcitae]|uniref:OsmC family protein n=1 Tax=Fundicoccus culcitae TaxID=2969821 RepID=A0ABY5P877_9LACT|nr:OsmC family protein [Fundicoccus culcitae]UUX34724.1 OsmC family protein [Fundicoccus culcitae]
MAIEIYKSESTLLSGLKVQGKSRDFELLIDEPRDSGGTDKGMNPVELLLNSLGACLAIVIKSFARSKHINLKGCTVVCEGELDPDGYKYINPNAKKGFSKITINIHIDADNTDEEIKEYIDFVIETCPVHDTITNTPEFETNIIKK